MACGSCGKAAKTNVQYEVTLADGTKKTADTLAAARVIRASAGGKATIRTIPKTA